MPLRGSRGVPGFRETEQGYSRVMREEPEKLSRQITTREDMAAFLDALSADAIHHGSEWDNLHIFDMLESMAAWLRDAATSHGSAHPELSPEQWRFVARLILAGKHYE